MAGGGGRGREGGGPEGDGEGADGVRERGGWGRTEWEGDGKAGMAEELHGELLLILKHIFRLPTQAAPGAPKK